MCRSGKAPANWTLVFPWGATKNDYPAYSFIHFCVFLVVFCVFAVVFCVFAVLFCVFAVVFCAFFVFFFAFLL